MQTTHLEQQIQSAQHRLEAMQQLANNPSASSKVLQNEAIAELVIALEALHVTSEAIKVLFRKR